MAKKNAPQIYVRVAADECAHREEDSSVCGEPRSQHGCFTPNHAFTIAPARFAYPTDADRRAIYEQLKDEFDGD